MNEAEKKIVSDIETYGLHVMSVFDPDKNKPDFSYSIGLSKTYGIPEILVLGLKPKVGAWVVNQYARRAQGGERFENNLLYSEFLEGFDICFKPVGKKFKEEFMLSCRWLYKGAEFEAVQMVYPTTIGIWPWEAEASEDFKKHQPSAAEVPEW